MESEPDAIETRSWMAEVLRRLTTLRTLTAIAAIAGIAGGVAGVLRYLDSHAPIEITGRHRVDDRIDETTKESFKGLQLGYDVSFAQTGRALHGVGEKAWERGSPLSGSRRTPIELDCAIGSEFIDCTFVSEGTRRKTTGTYRWKLADELPLQGSFTSTAAAASGPSVLSKLDL